jgi:hypothetical protein
MGAVEGESIPPLRPPARPNNIIRTKRGMSFTHLHANIAWPTSTNGVIVTPVTTHLCLVRGGPMGTADETTGEIR